jgi:calcium-dependent protein kinase
MGNCCRTPNGATDAGGGKKPKEPKQKKGKKPNPFSIEYNGSAPASAPRLVVLREPTGVGSRTPARGGVNRRF